MFEILGVAWWALNLMDSLCTICDLACNLYKQKLKYTLFVTDKPKKEHFRIQVLMTIKRSFYSSLKIMLRMFDLSTELIWPP